MSLYTATKYMFHHRDASTWAPHTIGHHVMLRSYMKHYKRDFPDGLSGMRDQAERFATDLDNLPFPTIKQPEQDIQLHRLKNYDKLDKLRTFIGHFGPLPGEQYLRRGLQTGTFPASPNEHVAAVATRVSSFTLVMGATIAEDLKKLPQEGFIVGSILSLCMGLAVYDIYRNKCIAHVDFTELNEDLLPKLGTELLCRTSQTRYRLQQLNVL